MNRILVILEKEWRELRQDRSLVLSTLLPPLLLTIMPLGIMRLIGGTPDEDTADLGMALADPTLAGLSSAELGQAVIGKQFALIFLLLPLIIPSIIAAYSIVGEKTRRTLEPVLATPISTWELLLAKSLTALIPAVGLTWACAAIFAAGTRLVALSPRVADAIVTPAWLAVLGLCVPPLALISVAAAVAISSRVNDPRTAQQLTAVAVVPFLALFFGQLVGVLVLSPALAIGAAVFLSVLAAAGLWVTTLVFQREAILTRWK